LRRWPSTARRHRRERSGSRRARSQDRDQWCGAIRSPSLVPRKRTRSGGRLPRGITIRFVTCSNARGRHTEPAQRACPEERPLSLPRDCTPGVRTAIGRSRRGPHVADDAAVLVAEADRAGPCERRRMNRMKSHELYDTAPPHRHYVHRRCRDPRRATALTAPGLHPGGSHSDRPLKAWSTRSRRCRGLGSGGRSRRAMRET
jgi:hypothetical protein